MDTVSHILTLGDTSFLLEIITEIESINNFGLANEQPRLCIQNAIGPEKRLINTGINCN
jgi:hypothetical protein